MTPLPYIFPYSVVFWIVFVWAFWPEFHIIRRARRPAGQASSPDARSYHVIVFGMWIAFGFAFPLAFVPVLRFPPAADVPIFAAGLIVLVAGSLLRRHCWRMLGESFTGDVRARPDQPVVTRGAYAIIRHPGYAAGIVMYLGVGLGLGGWASTLLLAIASFVTYAYRMTVEERVLLSAIGGPYRQFLQTRKRLIPFIY